MTDLQQLTEAVDLLLKLHETEIKKLTAQRLGAESAAIQRQWDNEQAAREMGRLTDADKQIRDNSKPLVINKAKTRISGDDLFVGEIVPHAPVAPPSNIDNWFPEFSDREIAGMSKDEIKRFTDRVNRARRGIQRFVPYTDQEVMSIPVLKLVSMYEEYKAKEQS